MLVRKRASKTKTGDPDEVDDNGILKDIEVPAIEKTAPARSERTKDVDAFFGVPYTKIGTSGTPKLHRDCLKCP